MQLTTAPERHTCAACDRGPIARNADYCAECDADIAEQIDAAARERARERTDDDTRRAA